MDNMVGKIRILLADSDGDFCAEMAALCEDAEDMELVGIAESGEKALTAVGELRPDLLITELSLPGMDGVLLLEQLRAAGNMPAVFVLSAFSSTQVCSECASLGVDVFLRKPIAAEKVCERIRLWRSGRKRMAREENAVALEVRVTEVIHQVGVPAHIKGYQYLRDAIILSVNDMEMLNSITKILYPTVAKKNQTTSSRVERAIRHAIDIVWIKGNQELLKEIFGTFVMEGQERPTNSQFIAAVADWMRLEHQIKVS